PVLKDFTITIHLVFHTTKQYMRTKQDGVVLDTSPRGNIFEILLHCHNLRTGCFLR
ncbi:hypothetical protein KIL84_020559, partial [Mauremys mutica]